MMQRAIDTAGSVFARCDAGELSAFSAQMRLIRIAGSRGDVPEAASDETPTMQPAGFGPTR
jgi:hypothetical protein